MNRTAAYLRVSTGGQTIENQRQKIEKWRVYKDLLEGSIDFYEEEPRSGKDATRPVMEELLGEIRNGHYNRIVVTAFDRWYRSAADFIQIWNEFGDLEVRLVSLREPLPETGPFADFMAKLFGLIGELEVALNSERTSDGMERRKNQGGHVSRPYLFLQWQELSGEDLPAGAWVVYRHEPQDPEVKGGRWRNRRFDFFERPGDRLLEDYHESRNAKALRFEVSQGAINSLRKCLTELETTGRLEGLQVPGSRIRLGQIGGGLRGVLTFVDGRWRQEGTPNCPVGNEENASAPS